ncbi:PH domain-containing protein, partial [Aphelenchoides avenae]
KSNKKTYYACLTERYLELHETSSKFQRMKKSSASTTYSLELSTCFNVARHYDPKLKQCISVVAPEETLIIKGHSDQETTEWFEALFASVVTARALRLGRPVLPYEFFEYVWDVTLVEDPKPKKPVPNLAPSVNFCMKKPDFVGHQRLCFYPHTIVVCKVGVEPALYDLPKTGIPPFRNADFFELQRQHLANFGYQEKFFIMRIGQSAPMGACELWARCESEEVASVIHAKLTEIINREAEKRRRTGILTPGMLMGIANNEAAPNGVPSSKLQSLSRISSDSGTSTASTTPVEQDTTPKPSSSNIASTSTSSRRSPTSNRENRRSITWDDEATSASLDREDDSSRRGFERFDFPARHQPTSVQEPSSIQDAIARDIFRCRQKTMGIPPTKKSEDAAPRSHTFSGYAMGRFLNILRRKIDSKEKVDAAPRTSPILSPSAPCTVPL